MEQVVGYKTPTGADLRTFLSLAFNDGNETIMERMISTFGPHIANRCPEDTGIKRLPLHIAASQGRFSYVKLLVKAGADVNVRDSDNFTPLHDAISSVNALSIVDFLLENGASVDARDKHGRTPLLLAAMYGDMDCVARLIESGADMQVRQHGGAGMLHIAAIQAQNGPEDNKHYEALKSLLGWGFDVNAQDDEGNTPLLLAAMWNRRPYFQLLLDAGADVNIANNEGETALISVAKRNDEENCARFLINGARIDHKDSSGKTVRDYLTPDLQADLDNIRIDDVRNRIDSGATGMLKMKRKLVVFPKK